MSLAFPAFFFFSRFFEAPFMIIPITILSFYFTVSTFFHSFQLLLNLAKSIFEEQTNLERLVSKIMKEAQELLKCERCLVYLRDVPLYEAVSPFCHLTIHLKIYHLSRKQYFNSLFKVYSALKV